MTTSKRKELYWQLFKTVVYLVGYSLCCLWIFNTNWNMMWYLRWSGSADLAQCAMWLLPITWLLWTFGVGAIIIDGMKEIGGLREHDVHL